jgi:hypothetical protein
LVCRFLLRFAVSLPLLLVACSLLAVIVVAWLSLCGLSCVRVRVQHARACVRACVQCNTLNRRFTNGSTHYKPLFYSIYLIYHPDHHFHFIPFTPLITFTHYIPLTLINYSPNAHLPLHYLILPTSTSPLTPFITHSTNLPTPLHSLLP